MSDTRFVLALVPDAEDYPDWDAIVREAERRDNEAAISLEGDYGIDRNHDRQPRAEKYPVA